MTPIEIIEYVLKTEFVKFHIRREMNLTTDLGLGTQNIVWLLICVENKVNDKLGKEIFLFSRSNEIFTVLDLEKLVELQI